MSYEPPIKITISTPSEIPIGFGPNSTGSRGGNLRVRCTNNEYDAIKHEAELLNITLATFTRWCAVHAAQKLLEHRAADMTTDNIGEDNELSSKNTKGRRN
jgi:hypothetical protein|tara:strand:+ start:1599 stop:1901 length:303 start_codon:yes stop_codon:yes gene_type:complete